MENIVLKRMAVWSQCHCVEIFWQGFRVINSVLCFTLVFLNVFYFDYNHIEMCSYGSISHINISLGNSLVPSGNGALHESMLMMMTSSNGNIFRVSGPLCGEFTGPGEFLAQRPVTRSFDVFFDLRPNKWLSKQPRWWWFETISWSLWCQCNVINIYVTMWQHWAPMSWIFVSSHTHKYHSNQR